jgi:hypothetical protein
MSHVALEYHHTDDGVGGIRLAAVTGDVGDFEVMERLLRSVVRY